MTKEDQIIAILKDLQSDVKEIKNVQKEHSAKLDEHSAILAEHSVKLDEHSVKLDEHSAILAEHSIILRALEHNTEVAKSERENIKSDLNQTIGKVKKVEKTFEDMAKRWIG